MAILIERNLNVMGDIPINQIYLRVQYIADISGKSLICNAFPYYNKDSFVLSPTNNVLAVDELKTYYEFPYDSSANGSDPLSYLHQRIKTELSTDIFRNEIMTDPSTGQPIIDPSTSTYVYEQIIITPKFAEDSSISFVDLE
jgi:hypothetical protein